MPAIDDLSNDVWDSIRSLAIRDRTTNVPDEAQLWNLSLVNCAFRDALIATKYRLVFERVLTRGAEAMTKAVERESEQAARNSGIGDAVTLHACYVARFFIRLHKMHLTNLFEPALEISYAAARACIDNVADMGEVLNEYQDSLGKIIRCPPLAGKLLDELGHPDHE